MEPKEEAFRDLLREIFRSEMSYTKEQFLNAGGKFHTLKQCRETRKIAPHIKYCPIHKPSNHKMKDWPIVVRSSTLLERTCPHGVGHPDPDSVVYMNWETKGESWGVHGCDGCCKEED